MHNNTIIGSLLDLKRYQSQKIWQESSIRVELKKNQNFPKLLKENVRHKFE